MHWNSLFSSGSLEELERIDTDSWTDRLDIHGNTPVHLACVSAPVHVIQFIIEQKRVDTKITNYYGKTFLMAACESTDLNKIQYLVNYGLDINGSDFNGNTPLHVACAVSSVPVIEYLLRQGADISKENIDGIRLLIRICRKYPWNRFGRYADFRSGLRPVCDGGDTPLHFAAAANSVEVLEHLLSRQNGLRGEAYLLLRACHDICLSKIQLLHKYGASPFDAKAGHSAIHLAAECSTVEVLRYLVEFTGCDPKSVNYYGENALHWACGGKDLTKVKYLHGLGLPVQQKSFCDQFPLQRAASSSTLEVMQYLIDAGSDPFMIDKDGDTILHNACHSVLDGLRKVMMLQNIGLDLNMTNLQGITPFMIAAGSSPTDVIQYMLDSNCDLTTKSSDGRGLLHYAASDSSLEKLQLFIDHGLDPDDKDNDQDSCLHVSAKDGTYESLTYLVDRGANVMAVTEDGRSVLYMACCDRSKQKIQYLLDNKLDPNLADEDGLTPLHMAAESSTVDVLKLLIQNGGNINQHSSDGLTLVHHACVDLNLDSFEKIRYLLTKGISVNVQSAALLTPLHVACRYQNHYAVQQIIGIPETKTYCLDEYGRSPWCYCTGSLQKLFIRIHLESNLFELSKLYGAIRHWSKKDRIVGLIWFAFAGGTPTVDDIVNHMEDLTDVHAYDILTVGNPTIAFGYKEQILAMIERMKGPAMPFLHSCLRKIPTLAKLCRAVVRNAITGGKCILNHMNYFKESLLLPFGTIDFLFLYTEMMETFSNDRHEIRYLLRRTVKQPVVKRNLERDSPDELVGKHLTPKMNLLHNTLDCPDEVQRPRWILDGMAQCCTYNEDAISFDGPCLDIARAGPSKVIVDQSRQLFEAYFSLLTKHDGPNYQLQGYGSLFQGTHVGCLQELDYLAIHDSTLFQIMINEDQPLRVSIPAGFQHYEECTAKQYLFRGLSYFLHNELRPENPAVCTVFAWQCAQNHRHSLSVDITPAIRWKGMRLGGLWKMPEYFHMEPLQKAKNKLENIEPILIPSIGSSVSMEKGYLVSNWELSFSCTSDIIWAVLNSISDNVRFVYSFLKTICNVIMPYSIKFMPRIEVDQGSWHGGRVASSWAIYNLLLSEVIRHPHKESWERENVKNRLVSVLVALSNWTYVHLFTDRREQVLNLTGMTPVEKEVIKKVLNHRISEIGGNLINSDLGYEQILDCLCAFRRVNEKVFLIINNASSLAIIDEGVLRYETRDLKISMSVGETASVYYFKFTHNLEGTFLEDSIHLKMKSRIAATEEKEK